MTYRYPHPYGRGYLYNQLDISIEKEPIYKDNEVNISNALLDKIQDKKTLIVLNNVNRTRIRE